MTNLNVTGNEAQFNEKVTFLKDVDIKGTLFVPDQELTLTKLTVSDIFGNPNVTFHDEVTFLDKVNFVDALSFTDLEIRDRLAVGVGGTVLVADSRLNPGKVGIGSAEPKELLDVGGKAKILDLDLRNLYVAGLSTFVGVSSFRNDVLFNGSSGITSIFFDKTDTEDTEYDNGNAALKFVDDARLKFGDNNDLQIYHRPLDTVDNSWIRDVGSGYLNLDTNGPSVRIMSDGFWDTGAMAEFNKDGSVDLYYDNVKKFHTTGVGITVLGDLIVPDVDGRVSRVGLGTTLPANPDVITELDDATQGPLRLDITGSISIGRNLYDSSGSHGENGMFLRRNVYGVRWVAVEPNEDQTGILIQDEGQEIPLAGTAQTFHTLNFVQGNSNGIGTDTLIPTAQAIPGTGIATITTFDLWGYVGSGNNAPIYRMSKVGVNINNPAYQVDISGTLHATQAVYFENTLTVDKHTELNQTLNVDGSATFQDNVTINADNKFFKIETNTGDPKFTVDTDNGNTDIRGTLDVTGATKLKNTLDVTGKSNFDSTQDASSATNGGAVTIDGGASVALKLFVGSDFDVDGDTTLDKLTVDELATFNKNIDANEDLDVDGDTTLDKLTVDELATFNGNIDANEDLDVDGRTELDTTNISESLNVVGITTLSADGGITTTGGRLFTKEFEASGVSTFKNDIDADGNLDVELTSTFVGITTQKSTMFMTQSSTSGVATFKNTVDLDGAIKDINDDTGFSNEVGVCKTDYRLASVGTGVSWRPSGVQTKRTIWVSKNGCDTNSGLLEGDAKATIGGAAAVAVETDTIKVRPGIYVENNPIGLRTDVTVTGEDLRLVIIQSENPTKDIFHVRRGCLIENLNFGGSNVGTPHDGAACVAFPTPAGANSAATGYTEPGPATEGPSGRWRSPYVRNCTNFMTSSVGMRIDGNDATASSIGADLKSMVCDSFTQYNENGIGVSLTNDAYAQLVSIFTINTDIGIYADTGAQCDLTNSNSSFGNFGLVAVGLGSTQFTGSISNVDASGEVIISTNAEEQDTIVAIGVTDSSNTPRRPFDGQALYFKIDLDNYPDTPGGGRITSPLQQLESVKLNSGVDLSGFSPIDPPNILIRDADGTQEPKGPQGIIAEATATVSPSGVLTEVNVVAQGRNYLPEQNIVVDIEGDISLATAVMEPIYYTVESATPVVSPTGITTITFNEFIPYELFPNDPFSLQRISRILTSSHSFEYVGTGTDINISTPLQGAIPIKANEVVAKDGAQIPFTSTDQKGNFDIGQGLQINQTTSTISGRDFSRSLQAEVTPLILALR